MVSDRHSARRRACSPKAAVVEIFPRRSTRRSGTRFEDGTDPNPDHQNSSPDGIDDKLTQSHNRHRNAPIDIEGEESGEMLRRSHRRRVHKVHSLEEGYANGDVQTSLKSVSLRASKIEPTVKETPIENNDGEYASRRSSRKRMLIHSSFNESDLTPIHIGRGVRSRGSPQHENGVEARDEMDMYTRVKRARRHVKRDMYGMPISEEMEGNQTEEDATTENEEEEEEEEEEEDEEEDADDAVRAQYNLRQNKPRTQLYEATIEKKRREKYFKDTPPKRRRYSERTDLHYKSPAHRNHKRKRASHRSSSTSSSGSESEDERRFARRKGKSMAKARQRCLPMNLTQTDLSLVMKDRQKIGASLADIDPMSVDRSITFDSVGGLSDHIQALKEMIVFPLLYPEVFERFKIAPPRGVLFHGPPGTGKTLVARALANECSTGEKKVAFFMRKGADCLSKWVGESERQLRLLFDQAYQVRPSIIFFDEIDGLAPVRSSRQDQIHSSIVSTLLALMDGLDSRGEVVVIGATNRIDSIDPALRRPGRFDREFLFTLPPAEARADILRIHTKEWSPRLLDRFIQEVAAKCNGYCGADMKALCTEAALHALRRRYPQIYTCSDKLQLDVTSIDISAADFHYAMSKIVPAGQRAVLSPGRPLSVIIKPLLHRQLQLLLDLINLTFPFINTNQNSDSVLNSLLDVVTDTPSASASVTECGKHRRSKSKHCMDHTQIDRPFLDFSVSAHAIPIVNRPRLLICGDREDGQTTHLAPALVHALEKLPTHMLDLPTLYANSSRTPEESCAQVFREARRCTPSVVYIPHIDSWWQVLSDTMRATFLLMINDLDPLTPILLLATSNLYPKHLPPELRILFSLRSHEQYMMQSPNSTEIRAFFEDLILRQTCIPPATKKTAARNLLEVLPKAPASKPTQLTVAEEKALWDQEEATLRELRLFLRDMLNKLARDKKFNTFAKPVDDEDVPDYYEIIKTPMDLSTMMSKIDLHQYQTGAEFLDDIDLICSNALEYNPADSSTGRAIRHRACALKDMAHALIDAELDEEFEKQCVGILESRRTRGKSPSKTAPKYYHTKPIQKAHVNGCVTGAPTTNLPNGYPLRYSRRVRHEEAELIELTTNIPNSSTKVEECELGQTTNSPVKKKRRKKNRWSRGEAPKPTRKIRRDTTQDDDDADSEVDAENPEETPVTERIDDTPVTERLEETPLTEGAETKPDNYEESTNSTLIGETADVPSSEPPLGDLTKAKRDLTAELSSNQSDSQCSSRVTEKLVNEQLSQDKDVNGDQPGSKQVGNESNMDTQISENCQSPITFKAMNTQPDIEINQSSDNLQKHVANGCLEQFETSTADNTPQADSQSAEAHLAPIQSHQNEVSKLAENKINSPALHETVLEVEASIKQKEMVRLTRSMTSDPNILKCREIIEQSEPAFSINQNMLPVLLDKAVHVSRSSTICQLEKLYSLLAQKVYQHRASYDRAALLQDLDSTLDNFAELH